MADPLLSTPAADIIEKVGLTIATIVGLVYVLKWLSQAHLKALNDRITTLEAEITRRDALIAEREARIYAMHQAQLAAAITNAHDMKSIAMQLMANDKANRDVQRVLIEKLNTRPCMIEDYKPHPTPPPAPAPETDRIHRHG